MANWQSAGGIAQRVLSSATTSSLALLGWFANLVLVPVVSTPPVLLLLPMPPPVLAVALVSPPSALALPVGSLALPPVSLALALALR